MDKNKALELIDFIGSKGDITFNYENGVVKVTSISYDAVTNEVRCFLDGSHLPPVTFWVSAKKLFEVKGWDFSNWL